jgi:tetratricopeptide (TPR) repeat protein
VNFGHNRSISMELAAGKADYHLLIDADMTLNVRGEFKHKLEADTYLIRHEGDCDYWNERLVSDRHRWRYVGATHEYIYSETSKVRDKLPELSVTHHEDGGSRSDKYERDIRLLKQELAEKPENARAVFYLAQSYRDCGNLAQAMEWYEKRATMGGWDEEVWYALYQAACLRHRLGIAWPLVLSSYLAAYQFRPTRLEPLFHIAKFYRENQEFDLGYLFSRAVVDAAYPKDILFIEKRIYESGLREEYAACGRERVAVGDLRL